MREVSLRAHVSRLLMVFGLAVTVSVALVSVFVNERLERSVWHTILSTEANQMQAVGGFDANESRNLGELRVYSLAAQSSDSAAVPWPLHDLAPGYHDGVDFDGSEHAVLVVDDGAKRRFLTYDTRGNEGLEQSTWNVMLLLSLMLGLGTWIIARVVAARAADSVLDLAAAVRGLPTHDRIPKLQKSYPVREVADIAASIDGLLDRIQGFVARERAFANALSHELTTPIAVIAGAVDVLKTRPNLPSACQPPLLRIEATARSMNDILKALLFLAREPEHPPSSDVEATNLCPLLTELIESYAAQFQDQAGRLHIVSAQAAFVAVPVSAATIVLGNLIRNALQHSLADSIEVWLKPDRFILRDNGRGMSAEAISRAYSERVRAGSPDAGGGLGLNIVQRVCNHIGWRFSIESAGEGGGTSITVEFGATVASVVRRVAR
jgi:signal transduction histidine kinase